MGWDAVINTALQIAGGIGDKIWDHNKRQEEHRRQVEFARHGIQWRAQDARAAGINPIFALGGSGPSYVPQQGETGTFQKMGQNITKNLIEMQALEIEEKKLDILGQKKWLRRQDDWHGRHMKGQPDADVITNPKERTATDPTRSTEVSDIPAEQWATTGKNRLKRVLSKDISEPAESDWWFNLSRMFRKGTEAALNAVVADHKTRQRIWNARPQYGKHKAPSGYEWRYNPLDMDYTLTPIGPEGHQVYAHPRYWLRKRKLSKQARDHRMREMTWQERYSYPAPSKYWK